MAYNVHDSIAKEVASENPILLKSPERRRSPPHFVHQGLIAENCVFAPALYYSNQYAAKFRKEICDRGIEAGGSIYGAMYSLPLPLSFEQVWYLNSKFSNSGVGS